MKTRGFAYMTQMLLALATLSLVAGEAFAQGALRECTGAASAAGKKGECVEFTVRYYSDKKVELVPDVTTKDSTRCTLGKDCKHMGGSLIDASTITLMQSNKHICYRVCSGGYCTDRCPVH